ncbi:molybdenum cofactor biosynthesis protein MoaE [Ketogulonicigenium vulgare]|uniref:Molybdopterin synthase catalytic subunit n=1 Tax=Ketogulonicigenium vulgare (strain WSH-001) TaxID=759362 RepID=F9Y8E8_KETVW|nr:molybdenum cofactor biosynthesis protein MoaE [Ketogulonicigenium vulgare]ADO41722.1 molybdopterin converting factor, subunit 2 [Ketogulonicigenium vulgare Y25]AEM39957.1 Molybdopterin-converting factor subunit 2 [Ketogulonicigenium vulgare WSH-001]ALJ80167.1 molybdenum cofactor biosynthesis protein MoaE [Ketogulonicigenium vulgare]ANW33031.1 molybdenum cofactor biosynthesis protein MoaE [Ketogulonicigenium vulgare]AOZ53653.1 molybdopterin converting factor, subunit 2 [Ketogulonicigenium vu
MDIRVTEQPFDGGAELNAFSARVAGAGAVVTFNGVVRDVPGSLQMLEVEHYPGMTELALREAAAQAITRWSLVDVLIIHRYGRLSAGEQIMMVATAAPHRLGAFEAAEFLMDYLKSRAPFWKKEVTADGEAWVEARCSDEEALKRWSPS